MKVLKWVLIAAGSAVLLFAGALAFIAATFDPNQYKEQVADLVKEKTQRTLTIEGDIRLMLFPKLGVRLGKTRLSGFRSSEDFAALDDMRVSLALIPLLSRQVVVDQIRLEGLRASLVKHRDGKTNFDDLLGSEGKEAPAKPTEPAKPAGPIKLEVDGIRVSNAAVTWKDEASGTEYAVSDFNLKTGHVAPGVPTKFDMAASIRASQPKTDVKLQAGGTLVADLDKQIFSVTGLSVKLTGDAGGISGLATELQAEIEARLQSRQYSIAKLGLQASGNLGKDNFKATLSSPEIEMSGGALAVSGLAIHVAGVVAGVALSEGSLRVPQLGMDLDRQTVLVDGVTLSAKGKRDADSFEAKLDAPGISITREKAGGSDVTLQVNAQGPQLDARASVKLSGLGGSGKALKIGQFAIDVEARQADNAIKGALSTPILANLESRIFQLPRLAGEFDATSPNLPMKKLRIPLSGAVNADLKKQTANADLAMKLDESNIKAKFAVADFAALRSTFDIVIDRLNVDKYLPPKKPGETGKTPAPSRPEQPIDFSLTRKLDVAGSVRIGDLVASNVKARSVRVDIRVKNGHLDVDPLSAALYQGSLSGAASVDANTSRIAVKQKLAGISIGPLLRDAAGQDLIEGRGNVTLDVTTTGNLVSAMKKTLNGTVKVELRDGAIKGINLAQSLRSAKALFRGGKREAEQGAVAGEKTDFSELTASFDIRNGVAHNGDLLVKSPFLRLTGEGDIDLATSNLNYLARASVVATSSGQGGEALADLKGLTIPVRASGPFTALKYKLEFGSVLSDSARQKLQEQKEAIKNKLEDRLRSQLPGKHGESTAPPAGKGQSSGQPPPPKPEDKLKEKLKKLF
jgi:AsmA protein